MIATKTRKGEGLLSGRRRRLGGHYEKSGFDRRLLRAVGAASFAAGLEPALAYAIAVYYEDIYGTAIAEDVMEAELARLLRAKLVRRVNIGDGIWRWIATER